VTAAAKMQLGKVMAAAGAAMLAAALCAIAPAAQATGNVKVLYAGSLVNLMERGIGPAFDRASGDAFQGFAGGSDKLANEIKGKLRQGDILVSANPKVNDGLTGAANGDWVSWYISFAQSPLVIGYNPSSKFAADFKSKPWYQVLQEPGVRIGRTDPKLDPKGALTVKLMSAAATFYQIPDLSQKIIGAPENPEQVFPEETLVGRLQSGQLDAGFFYSTETAPARIPAVALPPEIMPKAVYTVTILHNAPNPSGADRFVTFLLGPDGKKIMQENGLDVQRLSIAGDAGGVPKDIRALVDQGK
jgi:molybdate/tungstate transport system substrate-binding protein